MQKTFDQGDTRGLIEGCFLRRQGLASFKRALPGSSGKDDIFGDSGNDLIGGGEGSDIRFEANYVGRDLSRGKVLTAQEIDYKSKNIDIGWDKRRYVESENVASTNPAPPKPTSAKTKRVP